VTDVNGCKASDQLTVVAFPTPTFTLDHLPAQVCIGEKLAVADNWAAYQWTIDGNPAGNAFELTTAAAGTFAFALEVTNTEGCKHKVTKTVTVHALPVVSLDDRTVCPNTNTVYNGPAAMTAYLWADGSTANQFTASATGKVTLLVTDNNGCQNNAEATVTWFAQPVVEIAHGATQPTEVHTCPETDVTLTATPAFAQYLWGDGQTAQSIVVAPPTGGSKPITLTVTDVNGCKASDQLTVVAFPTPTFTLDHLPAQVCIGEKLAVADNWAAYQWTIDGNPAGNTFELTTAAAGTFAFALEVTNTEGCKHKVTKTITVHALPVVSLDDRTVCPNTNTVYNGPAAMTAYLWADGSTANQFTASATGKVTLLVTDNNSCQNNAEATVTWFAQPVVEIAHGATQPTEVHTCPETDVTLTATPAFAQYLWGDGETAQSIVVAPPSGGSKPITLTVTDINGCKASDQLTVVAFPTPTFTLDHLPAQVCIGEKLAVADNWAAYQWTIDGNPAGNAFELTTAAAGTFAFALEVTNTEGCKHEVTKTITVHALPVVSLDDRTVCPNTNTVYNGPAAMTAYLWADGSTANQFTASATGKVTLLVTDNNGCQNNAEATVTWFAQPVVEIAHGATQPTEVHTCPETDVTLTATPAFAQYLWGDGETVQSIVVAPPSGGSKPITLTVTDVNGCKASDQLTVVAFPTPTFTLDHLPAQVCIGEKLAVADNWAAYQWTIDGNPAGNAFELTTAAAGTFAFALEVTNTEGCKHKVTKTVTVHALPVVSLDDRTVCPNTNTVYNGPAAMTAYLWADGSTANQFTASATGKVTLLVTDNNGCQNNAEATVTWFAQPVVEIAHGATQPTEVHTCPETDVTLTATPAFAQYLWGDGQTAQSIVVAPPTGGSKPITLTVTDVNGCKASDQLTVVAFPTPTFTLDHLPAQVCIGEKLAVADNWAAYQWTIDGNPAGNTFELTTAAAGTFAFALEVTNTEGCKHKVTKTITVHALPVVSLDDRTVCPNTNTVYNGPAAMAAYLWADGSTANQFTASATGKVTLLVTDNNGCQNNAEATVTWFAQPVVEIAHGATQPTEVHTCPETDVTLTATPAFAQYLWGDGETAQSIVVAPPSGGSKPITLTVTDINGCKASDQLTVVAFPTPTFTLDHLPAQVCIGEKLAVADNWAAYQWTIDGNPAGNAFELTTAAAGTFAFALEVTNTEGCKHKVTKTVTVHALPVVSLDDRTVCPNTNTVYNGPAAMTAYLWADGSTANQFTASATGKVTLLVTDNNGCQNNAEATVTWFAQPVVEINYFETTVVNDYIQPNEVYTCPETAVPSYCNARFCTISMGGWGNHEINYSSATY
jgi:uncharacterized protein YegP (UPF0339 family)